MLYQEPIFYPEILERKGLKRNISPLVFQLWEVAAENDCELILI